MKDLCIHLLSHCSAFCARPRQQGSDLIPCCWPASFEPRASRKLVARSSRLAARSPFRYNPSMKTTRLFSLALLVIALASASSAKILVQIKDAQGKVVGSAILWESAPDRKSTRLNSSHANISYAVFS